MNVFSLVEALEPRVAPAAVVSIDLSLLSGTHIQGGGLNSGSSVSKAGDINGDGNDDFIIGVPSDLSAGIPTGSAYVLFGKTGGLGKEFDLSTINGNNGFKMVGLTEGDQTGFSVSNAGDLNGDGFADLIIGAPMSSTAKVSAGAAYVVFGATMFASEIQLSDLNGLNGFRVVGEGVQDATGFSVGGGGDFNGDGFSDLVIGAPIADVNGIASGAFYVLFGKKDGFDKTIDLGKLNDRGFRVVGSSSGDALGVSAQNAGDINGDGFSDLLIGAPGAKNRGLAYVLFGNDHFSNISLADLDGENGFEIRGGKLGANVGYSVNSAGDINGDGLDDLVVGAPSLGKNGKGNAYVIFGKTNNFGSDFNVNKINGKNGFQVIGERNSFLGQSVGSAGDVNGDGYGDLIIGGGEDGIQKDASAFVIFGKQNHIPAKVHTATLSKRAGFRIDGSWTYSVNTAGDVNNDGVSDMLIAGTSDGGVYLLYGAPGG